MKLHRWLRSEKWLVQTLLHLGCQTSESIESPILGRRAIANFCCAEFSKVHTLVVPVSAYGALPGQGVKPSAPPLSA